MNGTTEKDATALFERFRQKAQSVEIDGTMYWRLEGDLLLDENELRQYAQQRHALELAQIEAEEAGRPLVAEVVSHKDGRIVRWAPGVELTWTVLRKTFVQGGTDGYKLAVESVRKATADWEDTCGVKFIYKPELDESDSLQPPGALFRVREHDAGGKFIAAAFFPRYEDARRYVLIDPSFYSPKMPFNRTGVFRHELGHVLGFRHEHIRTGKPPACPDELTYGTVNLSEDYDPQSVMHYFCGGYGSKTLAITETDRVNAQKVYGLPLKTFYFVS